MSVTPRILVVDNDEQVGSDLLEMLEIEGYRVEVVRATGRRLISAANKAARRLRPHIAIVDLRLNNDYDTGDKSGLKVLGQMNSAHGILLSAHLSLDLARDIAKLKRVTWISKGERPEELLKAIRQAIEDDGLDRKPIRLTGYTQQQIVQDLFMTETTVPPDSVHVILRRLFPQANRIVLSPILPDAGSSSVMSRRHSVVLKAQVNNLEPVAVKLAPTNQIHKEQRHYNQVSGHLVGRYVAKLEATAEFWDLGGACYTFFGTSFQTLPSFHDHYHSAEDSESVLRPLKHLFGEVWGKLYGKTTSCRSSHSLFQRYDQVLHIRKHIKKLDACDGVLSLSGLPESLINPLLWIVEHHDESLIGEARLAITHGDLHAENLFVDGEHAWTIDFERTGSGHCLRDFIELETDIATRLALFPDGNLIPYFRFAVALAALSEPASPAYPDPIADFEAQKALSVISGIRKLAHQTTGYQNPQEYLWGLLLNAIFIGSLVDEQSLQRCRAFLLAAVLCERLSRWGQAWPPVEWLPICATP